MKTYDALLEYMKKYRGVFLSIQGSCPVTPQYQITYIGMIAIESLYDVLTAEEPPEYMKEAMEKFNITKEELVRTYNKWVKAQDNLIGEDKKDSIEDSLEFKGYFEERLEVRLLIEAMFARSMQAAWRYAVRNVTIVGGDPHELVQIGRMDDFMIHEHHLEEEQNGHSED